MDKGQEKDIESILVVDDDREFLEGAMNALKGANLGIEYEILGCGDGKSAIEIYRQRKPRPKVVVLDMMLPKVSGFKVLEKIKSYKDGVRVMMVTANEGKRHQQYAIALGVDGYLLKSPVFPSHTMYGSLQNRASFEKLVDIVKRLVSEED